MKATIEISRLAEQLVALRLPEHAHLSLAVVVPLAGDRRDVVREFLAEGPPFDPGAIGLERHQVFVTDREAVFVFETKAGMAAFERLVAEPEFWDVLGSWERCAEGEARVSAAVYEWPDHAAADDLQG